MVKMDIVEKGAILQRDRETFAVAPHIAGGICSSDTLRRIADVADKYKVSAIKITGAQRIALIGIREEDIDRVWADLAIEKGAAVGMCVRSIKVCPGTTFCKRGVQDSMGLGLALDEIYHGMEVPGKLKIGVSGCPNSCGESWVKDLGFIGIGRGFKVVVGGSAGRKPRLAELLTEAADIEEAKKITERVISFYKENGEKGERMGSFMDRIGGIEVLRTKLNIK